MQQLDFFSFVSFRLFLILNIFLKLLWAHEQVRPGQETTTSVFRFCRPFVVAMFIYHFPLLKCIFYGYDPNNIMPINLFSNLVVISFSLANLTNSNPFLKLHFQLDKPIVSFPMFIMIRTLFLLMTPTTLWLLTLLSNLAGYFFFCYLI